MTKKPITRNLPIAFTLAFAVCVLMHGCAGLHPIHGIPMDQVDPCLLQPERPRNDGRTIDLSLLGQGRPHAHIVDAGDVLGIYVEGVLGEEDTGPPVVSPSLGASPGALTTATVASAKLGFPVPVRADGTITLPYKPAIHVRGLSMDQVEARIRHTYSGPDGLLRAGRDRIFVTLHKPRTVRVLVVRKDRPSEPAYLQPPDYRRADDGRGTAVLVELPAFENDVLHALVASGGLPGPDAEDAVYVMRAGGSSMMGTGPTCPPAIAAVQPMYPQPPQSFGMANQYVSQQRYEQFGQSPMAPVPMSSVPASGIQQVAGRVIATMPVPATWPASPANPIPTEWRQPTMPHGASATVPHERSAPNQAPLAALADPFGNSRSGARTGVSGMPSTPTMVMASQRRVAYSSAQPAVSGIEQTGFLRDRRQRRRAAEAETVPCCSTGYYDATVANAGVRKIPLNILPGETPSFTQQDVLLNNGDIIFIESRSQEYFYTAGLLGGGKYPLPGNEDTDLLDAIALADSQRRVLPTRQIGGVSSLNQDVTIGASKVIIFREDQSGQTVPIRVDLNKLKRNPATAPVILPGDRVVLQYSKLEAFAAMFERHFLEGTVLGVASGVTFGNN